MSGSIEISSGSENDLQSAVANVGPIAVAVDASNNAFRVSPLSLSHTHSLSLFSDQPIWAGGLPSVPTGVKTPRRT